MRNVATVIFTGEWQVVREIDKLPSSEFEGPVTASPPHRLPILPGFLGLPLPALGSGTGTGGGGRGKGSAQGHPRTVGEGERQGRRDVG